MIYDSEYDVAGTADRLGMTRSAVRKAIARGTLAARQVRVGRGRKYLIDDREIQRYMRDHRSGYRDG